ncbi:RQC-minor-1 family DNA-binding protein [Paenibacillus sp. strain BS8-2]
MPKNKYLKSLPEAELKTILRAADDIIASGGRTLLAQILKGSKIRKLLELGLDRNPSYSYFKELTLEQIMDKVDHMILTGYLETERIGKLPMIVFTPLGWALEKERRAEEFVQEWNHWLENNITPISMDDFKDRNRGMMFLFLYKILCTGDKKYIPFLKMWESIDYKKVKEEIRRVIQALKQNDVMTDSEWRQLVTERAQSLLVSSREPIFLICQSCERVFLFDDTNPDYYMNSGLNLPTECIDCYGGDTDER